MQKNVRKKHFTSSLLALTLTAGAVLTPISVSANASNQAERELVQSSNEGIKITYENADTLEYTYNENGDTFKVVSKFNSTKTNIHNTVYKLSDSGEEEMVRESELLIGDKSATLSMTEEGKTNEVEVGTEILSKTDEVNKTMEANSFSINSYQDLGPWTYSFTQNYREDIPGATRDAIVSIIVGIYYWPAGAAGTAATLILSANSDAFWIEDRVSYKYIKGTNLPRGERSEQRAYADQAKQYFLYGPQIIDTYTTGWAP